MKQYTDIKSKYPDAILLFRVGDFYETFGEDAIYAAKILEIVLTNRSNGSSKIELAGFPYHSLDNYLPKLVRSGRRVAICDQLEDPKISKGIVKRGVTELVTPGLSYNDLVIEGSQNNFLASVYYNKEMIGVSFLDLSTGEFLVAEGDNVYIDKLLQSLSPKEVIFEKKNKHKFIDDFIITSHEFSLDDWVFTQDYTYDLLYKHFDIKSFKGFGVEQLDTALIAAGAILHYLNETCHTKTDHITSISRIDEDKYVWMDRFTIRNLEIFNSSNEEGKTLIEVLDETNCPMGSRLLRRWLALPLKDSKEIIQRQNIIEELINNSDLSDSLQQSISKIGDLERLAAKAGTLRLNPRECYRLSQSLEELNNIQLNCSLSSLNILQKFSKSINPCHDIVERIKKNINEDPPLLISKGNIIKSGFSKELDELRKIRRLGKEYLDDILNREIHATGISSLKISFNNVFGYYLEVRNTHKDRVPDSWVRKQTLVNAERYVTEELKEYEHKILNAENKIIEIENRLYQSLLNEIVLFVNDIQLNARIIGELDCLLSFSLIAKSNNYTKPDLNNKSSISIKQGRHPVIEQQLSKEDSYVPNDVYLDRDTQQIMMITGPNMSGKSALLRQTALIVLMAQVGSYVPCSAASIGIVDKIFTRVGASDNISMGESTFMVEMNETSSILNNLSNNSLVLLDEIGRGTSTYDGVSIAWAIAEYLHEHNTKAKTLFATHYHELNDMEKQFSRVKNFHVSVKENNGDILFIRELKEGGTNHSFGIHVAKISGMPKIIIKNADRMLLKLEALRKKSKVVKHNSEKDIQLSFVKLDDPILEQIRDEILNLDVNKLTPIDALMKLNQIKNIVG